MIDESAIYEMEKANLIRLGKKDLAAKVEWVSQDDDSLGYDINSFDKDGNEFHIEVKTNSSSKYLDFYITANELENLNLMKIIKYIIYSI